MFFQKFQIARGCTSNAIGAIRKTHKCELSPIERESVWLFINNLHKKIKTKLASKKDNQNKCSDQYPGTNTHEAKKSFSERFSPFKNKFTKTVIPTKNLYKQTVRRTNVVLSV